MAAAREHRPDAIVADITMPALNGIDAAARLKDLGVPSRVVFLTMHRDVACARRAMQAGAHGFVLKHSASAELVTAVRAALLGRTCVTPRIAGELLQPYQAPNRAGGPEGRPTARQREVPQLIAQGQSAKEIAAALGISVRTAEAHKARILQALGLDSTAALVQYAIRHGIISV